VWASKTATHHALALAAMPEIKMNYFIELLDISKSDLDSSRILYRHGHFPQSYFLFQQSVEKANKAFGLMTGVIKEDELLNLGHDQIKIFKKSVKSSEKMLDDHRKLIEPFDKITNHEFYKGLKIQETTDKIKKADRAFDSFRNLDLVRIDKETVDSFINDLNSIRNEKIVLTDDKDQEVIDHLKKCADWIGEFGTEEAVRQKNEILAMLNDQNLRSEYFNAIKQMLPILVDMTFINMTLYLFGILTMQHSSRTRYIVGDARPSDIYVRDLPVIEKLLEMTDILDDGLSRLRKIGEDYGIE